MNDGAIQRLTETGGARPPFHQTKVENKKRWKKKKMDGKKRKKGKGVGQKTKQYNLVATDADLRSILY